jgi:hypothetical protein
MGEGEELKFEIYIIILFMFHVSCSLQSQSIQAELKADEKKKGGDEMICLSFI